MSRNTISSWSELGSMLGVQPKPVQKKQKNRAKKNHEAAVRKNSRETFMDIAAKQTKASPNFHKNKQKDVRHCSVCDNIKLKENGIEEGRAKPIGMTELAKFKVELAKNGLELFGCEVRKQESFADAFYGNNTICEETAKLIKAYQEEFDSVFRRAITA
ncbi:hypothetical protein Churi_gp098 [Pseudomonas phage Churi]|nr:hypothetical protein Churi01_gp098 [Pseudomonas phage Churi01]